MTTAQPSPTPHSALSRNPPVVREGLLGLSLRAFRSAPLEFLCRAAREHGNVVEIGRAPLSLYLVAHPEGVQHILVDHNKNYDKKTRGYDTLRAFLGNGLLTSEGDFWRRQRRIAQPAFHRQRIASFADTMVAYTLDMLRDWERKPKVDIEEEMTGLTLRIVAKTLLSTEVDGVHSDVGQAVSVLNVMAREQMMNPFSIPLHWPTPRNRRYRQHAGALDEIVLDIIAQRRADGRGGDDLLGMLMEATDAETGERMSDQQLRDEAMTMFLAGHETTANALAWTFYLLSRHPDVQRKVRFELADVLRGRTPSMDELPKLELLTRVIQESMRLYPPAWSVGRRSVEADEIDGFRLRAGALVIMSPYVTHRHPAYWHNPEGFDPDRFLPHEEKRRPKYAYFPFAGGPRQCIGNGFAMMEAQLILATVLQRFNPALQPGHPVVAQPLITLRPKYGLPMTLRPATDA